MPFSKGDPNINRAGRPKKGQSIKELLRDRIDVVEQDGTTRAQKIVEILSTKATDGDLKAIEMVLDRIDGKPNQHITSENDNKIVVEHEIAD